MEKGNLLTTDEKQTTRSSRRHFLAGSAAGLGVLPRHVLGGKRFVAPSDTIYTAIIGVGSQDLLQLSGPGSTASRQSVLVRWRFDAPNS